MDSQLLRSTGEVASRFLPFAIPSLSLAYLGKEEKGFYALVPSTKCSLLSFLERACVMDLDAFRAPLKTEDVARRGHLSLEERSNLYMWGYHRVLDSFRFHITLTDGIADAGLRALVGAGLRKALEGVLDAPLRIDALTLFKQENRNRPFSAVARLPFANVQTAREKHDVSHRSTRKDALLALASVERLEAGLSAITPPDLRGSPRAGNRAGHDPGPRGQHRRRLQCGRRACGRAVWVSLKDGCLGYAWVLGEDARRAELAALYDALWQRDGYAEALDRELLPALEAERARRVREDAAAVEPTRVDFFTLVRGED